MQSRLEAALSTLASFEWTGWAGALVLDPEHGRLPLHIGPDALPGCKRGRATPGGSWPTILAASSAMLRQATHPALAGVSLDLSQLDPDMGRHFSR